MKKLSVIVFLCATFIVSSLLIGKIAGKFPYTYNYEHDYYKPHGTKCYLIPSSSHVLGYVSSNGKFSVYVLSKDELKNFEHRKKFNTLMARKNVSYVKLNMTVPNETCYLVVVNEEKHWQWITVEVKTKK
jgi:hypothetical protein